MGPFFFVLGSTGWVDMDLLPSAGFLGGFSLSLFFFVSPGRS